MIAASATHPGLLRKNNEDCIRTDDRCGIYLLADGVGGHNAGEVASALAVETVYGIVRSNLAHTAVDDYFELMVHALHTAHWEIQSKAQADPLMAGMGTTLVFAVILENKAYVVSVGDSRCYHFQRGYYAGSDPLLGTGEHRFRQLTHDHTLGDQLLSKGVPLDQIPRSHFHALTRSLGCGNPPFPDLAVVEVGQEDLLLLCSDGLSDMLPDTEIEAILAEESISLQQVADRLVDAANARGGRDNISVVLVTQCLQQA